MGTVLAGVLAWFFFVQRGARSGDFLEPLDEDDDAVRPRRGARYSSTKISAADVEARLGGTVSGSQVETDKDYALVVDEEALKSPLPGETDERTGRPYVDDSEIRELLRAGRFDDAYARYLEIIESDGEAEFHADLERKLSEYYLRKRDLEKAVRILEHHVATHASEDIDPETYFNLGYAHVMRRTLNKSRRFLRLFVETTREPEHRERAKRILQELENLN